MEQTPHERLCAIFEEALSLEGSLREGFLEKVCAGDADLQKMVEKMLRVDSAKSTGGLGVAVELNLEEEFSEAPLPAQIGPYRIKCKIGAGGMGIVYEAEQDKPQRSVALKVMRVGSSVEQAARFELESEVLGWLQHPYIAHVYGAGTATTEAGPRPWISMELVDGLPIDEYGRKNDLGLKGKLELVIKILEGVSHAHSRGVVHRDLKPGNVLVDGRGEPHIVDFGVARVLDGWDGETRTQLGDIVGTLAYMSPEQVSGDPKEVSTQSDIYSVGTIAFELLSGDLPLDLANQSITRAIDIIREGKKKSLRSQYGMPQDLASIVHKALDREPERRYQSADVFADDIRRFLRGDAILARPPSAFYQLKCLGRRNKVASAAIGAALISILAGGAFSTYRFLKEREANDKMETALVEASDARDEAVKQAELSNRGLRFYGDLISRASQATQGTSLTVLDMVEQAAQEVPEVFPDAPQQQAHLLLTFSIANFTATRREQALGNIERVVRLIEDTPLDNPMFANAAYMQYSVVLGTLNRGKESLEAIKDAVAVVANIDGEREKWGHARAVEGLAMRYATIGDYERGLEVLLPVVENLDDFGGKTGFRGSLLMSKAGMLLGLSRNEEAAQLAREAYASFEQDGLESGPRGIDAKLRLGTALVRSGKQKEALVVLLPLADSERKVNGGSGRLSLILRMTAECHVAEARHQDAIQTYTEAIEVLKPFIRRPNLTSANCWHDMGNSHLALGSTSDAISAYQNAILDLEGSSNPAQFIRRASIHGSKANAQRRVGKLEEALVSMDAAIADLDACNFESGGHSDRFNFLYFRSRILSELKRWDQAGKGFFETLSVGVNGKVHANQWPNLRKTLKDMLSKQPDVFEGYAEDVRKVIKAAELTSD